jgi:hypothetical protein
MHTAGFYNIEQTFLKDFVFSINLFDGLHEKYVYLHQISPLFVLQQSLDKVHMNSSSSNKKKTSPRLPRRKKLDP